MQRDDFKKTTKETLAERVGFRCSLCECPTRGPDATANGSVNVGVAAHIAAAATGGPRYDAMMSKEDRAHISNGIWLCQTCAKLIDSDVAGFPSSRLVEIRDEAVKKARGEIVGTARRASLPSRADVLVEAYDYLGDPEDWRDALDDESMLYCVRAPAFTIRTNDSTLPTYFEGWMSRFPDQSGTRHEVRVYWNETPIHRSFFVSCDGARYFLPIPKLDGFGGWYLRRESMPYRLARLYRQYAPLDATLSRCGIRLLSDADEAEES